MAQSISTSKGAPKFMRDHSDATSFYSELLKAAELSKTGTASDKIAAAMAASVFIVFKAAEAEMFDEDGNMMVTVEQVGDKGQVRIVQNPAYQVYITSQKQIQDYLKEFGLTPKARKQVEKLEAEKKSALTEFMQGGM